MSITNIGWTSSPLLRPTMIRRDVAVDGKVFIAKGKFGEGHLLPGFTFNPVMGCSPISRACRRCYAKTLVEGRFGYNNPNATDPRRRLRLWGAPSVSSRIRTSPEYWRRPRQWNRLARDIGTPLKVFCGSLCDIGEDHPELTKARPEVFELADATPWLTWLFLTKRPEVLAAAWPEQWRRTRPRNVWVGSTTEDQPCADERVWHLLGINAEVAFVSVEPMVGPVSLTHLRTPDGAELDALRGLVRRPTSDTAEPCRRVAWTIAGGETGPGYETMNVAHLHALAEQVQAVDEEFCDALSPENRAKLLARHESLCAFYAKQDSGHAPSTQGRIRDDIWKAKRYPTVNHAA